MPLPPRWMVLALTVVNLAMAAIIPGSYPTVQASVAYPTPAGTGIESLPTAFCDPVTEIPAAQCQALEALYNSTDGPNWTNNSDWLVTETPCSWYGVTCKAGHVSGLSLYNNNLSGSLPPELGDLANLESLDLSYNAIQGAIPAQLGNLASLQYLYLGHNQLTGTPEGWAVPAALGDLGSLITASLDNNVLTGNLPETFGDLASLNYLYLQENQISGSIPSQLGNLSQLRWLFLQQNQLQGSIPAALGNLGSLERLFLNGNSLSGAIPLELGNLSNLQRLTLNGNHLGGLPDAGLGSLTNLVYLYLHDNQFSGALPLELTALVNLEYLKFEQTDLCEPADSSFQQWLQGVSTVTSTGVPCELTLSKEGEPILALASQPLTYTLAVRNATTDTVYSGIVLTDTLPLSVTLQGTIPTTTTQEGRVLTWNLGALDAGQGYTATITVSLPVTGTEVLNEAIVRGESAAARAATATPLRIAAQDSQAYYTSRVFQVAGPVTASIDFSNGDVLVTWGPADRPVFRYEVWWGENDPYFATGGDCQAAANCQVLYALEYLDAGGSGNEAANYSYLVLAVNEAGPSQPSNRVAEFDYALAPGEE